MIDRARARRAGAVLWYVSAMRPPLLHAILACCLFAVLPGGSALAAPDIADALDRIYDETDYQRKLPGSPPDVVKLHGLGIPPAAGWLVLAVAVLGAVVLALRLTNTSLDALLAKPRAKPRKERRRQPQVGDAAGDAETGIASDWLRTADGLARQGRFAEAIHAMLLGILRALPTKGNAGWSPAVTGREILHMRTGADAEGLGVLIRTSELVHFGGRPGSEAQYLACRQHAVELDARLRI